MQYLRWIYNGTPSQTLPEGYYPSGPPAAKSVSPFRGWQILKWDSQGAMSLGWGYGGKAPIIIRRRHYIKRKCRCIAEYYAESLDIFSKMHYNKNYLSAYVSRAAMPD
jgi:hypothetical protein